MTSPLYRRDAAHERRIMLDLAAYHDGEAAQKDGRESEDHLRAAAGCREWAERWRLIGQRAAAAGVARK